MQFVKSRKIPLQTFLSLLAAALLFIPDVNAEVPYGLYLDDLSGKWKGSGWGTITLKKKSEDIYVGTFERRSRYSGTIKLSFKGAKGIGSWTEKKQGTEKHRKGQLFNIVISERGRKLTGKYYTTDYDYGSHVKDRRFTWRR
jgi:hypothetical protein